MKYEAREAYEDDRETNERLKEIAVDARARLETLSEYFNFAGQQDEAEVNLSDALNLMLMVDETARLISKKLNGLLIDNGVHIREAC